MPEGTEKARTSRLHLPWRGLAIVLALIVVAAVVIPRKAATISMDGSDAPEDLGRIHNVGVAVYDLSDSPEDRAGIQASSSRVADDLLHALRPSFTTVVKVPAESFEAAVRTCTIQTLQDQTVFPDLLIGACANLAGLMAKLHLDALLVIREQETWVFPDLLTAVFHGLTSGGPKVVLGGTLVFADGSKAWRDWVGTGAGLRSGLAEPRALAVRTLADDMRGRRTE